MGWDRSYRQLLCRNLIPLLDEWRAGAVSDLTIREVIVVIGMFHKDNQVSRSSNGSHSMILI
jgi:hypothetical protein